MFIPPHETGWWVMSGSLWRGGVWHPAQYHSTATAEPQCLHAESPTGRGQEQGSLPSGRTLAWHFWKGRSRPAGQLEATASGQNLTCLPFFSKLFAEEQAEGPGRLLYQDGFSTILHLLLGSPRPAATTLHAELCRAGPSQGLSLCESWCPGPCTGTQVHYWY